MSDELFILEQLEESQVLDSGNTAWIIVSTILVLMMTIPGLALFYGGLVRRKNILSVLMQCLILTAVLIIEWVVVGYSLAFTSGGDSLNFFVGGFDKLFLNGIGINDLLEGYSIPELLFVSFQGMFAVITPALIIGAFAERIRFKGFLLFSLLWALLVYNPLAHWVWGGGWIAEIGAIDFAGGTVVHINAGVSALIMAILLGKRKGWNIKGEDPITPHNIPFVVIGTALLWLGWLGFNGGSGLSADGLSANAILVTNIAAAVAAITWTILDQIINKKPTVVGFCTGVVATQTTTGVGGVQGALYGDWNQLWIQVIATIVTILYSALMTWLLFNLVDRLVGLRISSKGESVGLDISEHGEIAYE